MYGLADGKALETRRSYEDRFPDRYIPDTLIFPNIHRILYEKGSL